VIFPWNNVLRQVWNLRKRSPFAVADALLLCIVLVTLFESDIMVFLMSAITPGLDVRRRQLSVKPAVSLPKPANSALAVIENFLII
jgi:hypothetical protein